ncbi:uncharacterized protein B0H18DRAFT_1014411 [Fomitopsis serialis]|uniref:uncharacterized protein n=1 Tax=Fomitopsis serialis TaxID=139415 RepID=UPI00200871DA|nr:uncharacterized protein B0H18DRAFT_1014411 [Neoantrodia serialis]KAH9923642.1 hypothetical protein B0H18DRAFT_1014411 [Neoantrodia serialis]
MVIAVALSIILHGKRTGCAGSDSLITRFIIVTLHQGIVTAILQFLQFATYVGTFHSGSSKLIWALFYFPASKIITNSLLTT